MFTAPKGRILVIGDIMLDKYTETSVGRISPEAPVIVARVHGRWTAPGGAANVARNLATLGCAVSLIGVCGEDAAGRELGELLEKQAIRAELVRAGDRPTTCKTRVMARGQHLLRLDEEIGAPVQKAVLGRLREAIDGALPDAAAVILSDYGKGVLSHDAADSDALPRHVIEQCRKKGIAVLVDPKGDHWERYAGADCITPNTKELAHVLRADPEDMTALCGGAAALMNANGIGRILLTRSQKGMALIATDGKAVEIPARAREVCDVSGAGDTVIAVLAACIAGGMDWLQAARIANIAAGIVVGKVGTSPVLPDELNEAIAQEKARMTPGVVRLNEKVQALDALLRLVKSWRDRNETIVFTNGCFDLLHIGHVQLIQEAARQGDRLIVAVNSDASVKRLKGPERPIQPQAARALVMAGLDGVDAVTIFDEDTPLALIEAVTPDVLVKGGDYDPDTIVGAAHVRAHGGRVHIAKLLKGFSTTGIVKSIA